MTQQNIRTAHSTPTSTPTSTAPISQDPTSPDAASVVPHEEVHGDLTRDERRAQTQLKIRALSGAQGQERDQLVEDLVVINRPVAWAVASRYTGRGIERDDIRQVAVEGLFKSVIRFDPERKSDLLSFAVPTMTGEIRRHFRDRGWMVRPPRRLQELQQRSSGVREELAQSLGRMPSSDEVARELGVCRAEYLEAEAARDNYRAASLDVPLGEDGAATLGDLVPDTHDQYESAQARVLLAPVLRQLSPADSHLLDLRFSRQLSQSEIGRELGISQAQVSRSLARLLDGLRFQLEESPEEDCVPA